MATLQGKMGFQDDDLKTPQHDKIMLWVQEHASPIIWAATEKKLLPTQISDIEVSKVEWEVPVSTENGYTIGFVDMIIYGKWPFPRTEAELADNWSPTEGISLVIEVKTAIPNVGELLRQLNLYRGARQFKYGGTRFVVVSPDDRFASVLRSQGIAFYKYEQTPEDEAMQ